MKYIIADRATALSIGFDLIGHRSNGEKVVLNEKEVMDCPWLGGSLEERAAKLGGEAYTERYLLNKITKKWEYE